jgi:hypothetical protein
MCVVARVAGSENVAGASDSCKPAAAGKGELSEGAVKACMRGRGTAPRILNYDTEWS